jgi:predicted MFS family arabinose efflux permease
MRRKIHKTSFDLFYLWEILLTQPLSPSWPQKLTAFFGVSLHVLMIVFIGRLTIDTGTRLVYPFIPQFAAGLGLTIVGFSWLLSVRALAGMVGPVFGVLADKYGRRNIMTAGLLSQAMGVTGLALTPGLWAIIPVIFYGLSLSAFIPAEQAYISELVPYQKRGRALATIELAWACAGIFGLPLVGWMIDALGWRSPLLVMGGLSLLNAMGVWRLLPPAEGLTHQQPGQLGLVIRKRNVQAAMLVGLLVFVAVGSYSTVWSIWFSAQFGLTALALGGVATVTGLAELTGAGTASLFLDRLGKKRGTLWSLGSGIGACLLLPLTQDSLPWAILGLALLGVTLEFAIVALVPIYSEQAPEARATVFALVGLGVSIGVSIASPVTAILWETAGLWAVCAVAVVTLLAAIGLVSRYLQESS